MKTPIRADGHAPKRIEYDPSQVEAIGDALDRAAKRVDSLLACRKDSLAMRGKESS